MLRTALILLLLFHGAVHFIGVEKAFGWADLQEISRPISKPMGLVWAGAMALLIFAAMRAWMRASSWWVWALAGLLISQVLIIQHWQDARFGTIANVLILIVVIPAAARWNFKRAYDVAAEAVGHNTVSLPGQPVTTAAVQHLPVTIQKYLAASGAMGRQRPRSLKLKFKGELRYKGKPWMPFRAIQYNRLDIPERHFWLDATMKGLPVSGYHRYTDGKAHMMIRVMGLVPVADQKGEQMDQAETVTWFNDLCLFAPGALVDERITWEEVDDYSVKATFTNSGITISAILVFNEEHQVINFISDDRFYLGEDGVFQSYPFHTPVAQHRKISGHVLPHYGEAAWMLPDGLWSYGKFELRRLWYNVK